MTSEFPTCSRCGATLKVIPVKVPVYRDVETPQGSRREITGYEWRDEVADCPRCQGAF